jgi:hypothetical protein
MNAAQLSLVPQSPERPSARAARLLAEARGAARDQVEVLERALAEVLVISNEIVDGGEAYPAGARDLCRRLNEEIAFRAQTLGAIMRQVQDFR